MSKPIVICIDDEQIVLDSLIREISGFLENECDIETALGGLEALDLVDELLEDGSEIALVISDYIMPDLKGDEVLRCVHEKLPQTLKIMLTGKATVEGIMNSINSAKLYRYISKPWHKVDFKLTVKEAIDSYTQQRNIEDYNRNLESLISERTQQLKQKNEELANTLKQLESAQQELIHSEKMAALGQLIAGVAHEINTPLGAIQSSVKYIGDYFSENLGKLPTWFRQLTPEKESQFKELLARSLANPALISGRERRQLRKAIVAQLETQNLSNTDTIANLLLDLKIYENIEPLFNLLQDPSSEIFLKTVRSFVRLQESTRDINTASERAAKVVFALKTYARQNLNEEKITVNIVEGLEAVLTLYQNQIKHGVELIKNYEDLPPIECYFDELNQVWTNLIHNALQAMNYRGILRVDATRLNGNIQVMIIDSGNGIPEEIQDKIFQPFFTTKPPGEGSGLGLDIVKKIIEKHGGTINFRSMPGQTIFVVTLPADI